MYTVGMTDAVSPRQQIAINLADTVIFGELTNPYGGTVAKASANGKDFWEVSYSKPKILDGSIRVYGPGFILVTWQTAIRDMVPKGSQAFKSEHAAKEFLIDKFIRRFL